MADEKWASLSVSVSEDCDDIPLVYFVGSHNNKLFVTVDKHVESWRHFMQSQNSQQRHNCYSTIYNCFNFMLHSWLRLSENWNSGMGRQNQVTTWNSEGTTSLSVLPDARHGSTQTSWWKELEGCDLENRTNSSLGWARRYRGRHRMRRDWNIRSRESTLWSESKK
jgi:hypothetical protein